MKVRMVPPRQLSISLPAIQRTARRAAWWAAGAAPTVLEKLPSGERLDYATMGAVALATSACAFAAAAYAIHLISRSILAAAVGGALWAGTILAVDRVFLALPRASTAFQEVLRLLPRLVLALFAGIVMAYPIQLAVFATATEDYAELSRARAVQAADERLAGLQERLSALERQTEHADRDATGKLDSYMRALQGRDGTGVPGLGPAALLKRQIYEDAASEARQSKARASTQIAELSGEVAAWRQRRRDLLAIEPTVAASVLARMEAFAALRKHSPTAAWGSALLTALVVLIQILPLAIKVLRRRGLYEHVIESHLHEIAEPRAPDLATRSQRTTGVIQRAFTDALDESRFNPTRLSIN